MISAAGKLQGLHDPRFTYFFDLVCSTNYLSEIEEHPPLYLFENTYPLGDVPNWVHDTTVLVKTYIGRPAVVDAISSGGASHRLRCLW